MSEGVELQKKGSRQSNEPEVAVEEVVGVNGFAFLHKIVSFWLFDTLIICCIVFNTLLMAAEDPRSDCGATIPDGEVDYCDGMQQFIYGMEFVFLVIYTSEAFLKIGAYFPYTYFAGPDYAWNLVDFGVVVIAYISLANVGANLSVLRTVRLMRMMRTLNIVPAMKKVAMTLINSMPLLSDVLILCVFMLIVFTVFGLQLFMGSFRHQCVEPDIVNGTETYANWEQGEHDFCTTSSAGYQCEAPLECMKLPAYIDGQSVNPENGNYHYDDFGMAFLTVFLLTTAEGWTGIMYQSMDATGQLSIIYYMLVIWIGTLITISLALAALESAWGDEEEDEEEEASEPSYAQKMLGRILGKVGAMEKKISPAHTEFGRTCKVIAKTNWFDKLTLVAIVVNTVVLGMERANMSASERDTLDFLSEILLWYFVAEAVIKICGFGFSGYASDSMNIFDLSVVIISLVEYFIGGKGLSVFRSLRLLRILKLMKSWKSLRRLVQAMVNSLKAASALTMILVLFMFVFALLGKEFFAYKLPNRAEKYHYDTFGWAFITVFVVLSGENWNALMFDAMSDIGRAWSIYFVLIIILGGYVILNLFIAIVLDELMNATDEEDDESAPRTEELDQKEAWITRQMNRMMNRPVGDGEVQEKEKTFKGAVAPIDTGTLPGGRTREELLREKFDEFDNDDNGFIEEGEIVKLLQFFGIELTMLEYHVMFADERFTWDEFLDLMNKYKIVIDENMVVTSRGKVDVKGNFTAAEKEILDEYGLDASMIVPPDMKVSDDVYLDPTRSLFIFHHENRFRIWMKSLAENSNLNNFVLFVIMASTVCVAVDEPGTACDTKKVLNTLDFIFTIIFTLELVIKVIAMGLILNPHAYLVVSHFNKLDFVVVVVSLATVIIGGDPCGHGGDGEQIGALKALRAFRALRPLRTVGRVENLKVVVNALMQSAIPIANVLALMAFFFLLFGILGVQFFAGKFNFCNVVAEETAYDLSVHPNMTACPESDFAMGQCGLDADGSPIQCTAAQCYTCFSEDGLVSERAWSTYHQNFDNTIQAMVVLFEMATLEAWPSIALYGVDSTGMNTWPSCGESYQCSADPRNTPGVADMEHPNMLAFAYFILFILMGTFFVANLFASVACDKYENMSQFYSGMLFLTESQKVWVIDSKQVWAAKPKKIANKPVVKELEVVALDAKFDLFILICIMVNIVVMSLEYADMSDDYAQVMASLNWAFVAIFTCECILKILGLGPEAYIADHFNKFDLVIVIASIVSQAIDLGSIASVFRIFRITKILKMIPKFERLMAVVMTVYHSIPALANVALLTALFFLIFSCLGMSLFGEVAYGAQISRHNNFETFGFAMLSLFRVATGEDWNGMMYDCAIAENEYGLENQQCYSNKQNYEAAGLTAAYDPAIKYPCPTDEPCGCGMPYVSQIYFVSFNVLAAFVMLNVVVAAILTHFDLAKKSSEGLSDRMVNAFKDAWWVLDPDATARIQLDEFATFYKMICPTFGFDPENAESLFVKCEVSGGELRFSEVLYVCAFEKFGQSLGVTRMAKKLEDRILRAKVKLDNEPGILEKPILPQITEAQLSEMTNEELKEQLVLRGHVRFKNRSIAT